ncbi:hypothetical protein ASPCADRAFT_393661 [Aspergillus carbonarius ITEM 5010]|uniref:HD domain-containing protein n=1 Tax=Aspergillus carbonarius (strain ITEM 5010) TaxID=602072 RepID=A0A1R3RZN7_ASPC5|nr:hypothetical protein ASPCADRAFT_393661 [Aspergillus carbonarius ITEM 5010]
MSERKTDLARRLHATRDKRSAEGKTAAAYDGIIYIGESISQLEHSLQAAHQAQKASAQQDLILAALLHDIGQIIPLDSTKEIRMNLKSDPKYLRSLGFSERVCRLVESHVPAKRYLTATNITYYETLSSASKKSLEFQGGPFKGAELAAFARDPLRDDMVALRLWDDAAKVPGIEALTPRAGEYRDMIQAHLEGWVV